MRLRVQETGLATYPDAAVVCGKIDYLTPAKTTYTNPIVLVEVLSPSTEKYDQLFKIDHYRRIPTLREYVIVRQDEPWISVYARNEDRTWTLRDVRSRLAAASAGDRAVLTREVEKLALYLDAAPDRPREADGRALDAIGADLGEAELFSVIETVIDGRVADVGAELARLAEAGGAGIPLLRQLARRLVTLAELRGEVDAGASIDEVLEKHRIFFREKAATGRALKRWNASQIARAVDRAQPARGSGGNAHAAIGPCAFRSREHAAADLLPARWRRGLAG